MPRGFHLRNGTVLYVEMLRQLGNRNHTRYETWIFTKRGKTI